ncbi:MAG: guanylate kinase [Gemmatimonadota bacterium]|nr:MAG: guanylate kinase [Gemmatimonadota bacterium]
MRPDPPPPPLVLAAPSGTGKTTIARSLVGGSDRFRFSVSATTRPRREHERDGVDYHFMSPEAFMAMRDAGELAEWAEVHGHLYGTLRSSLSDAASRGEQVVLDIDVQGARQLKEAVPEALLVFIIPPSVEVLVERLRGRGTERESDVLRRLTNARDELAAAGDFDFVVVNENLADAVTEVSDIALGRAEPPREADAVAHDIAVLRGNIDRLIEQEFTEGQN